MKRFLVIFLAVLMCMAPGAVVIAVAAPPAETAGVQADAVSAASPNYRTFTEQDLKSMRKVGGTLWGGHYTCQKSSTPYTYFEQDWKGVDLSYLLEQEVGIKDDTTGIRVVAEDGYGVSFTLDEMRGNSNPRGLPTILGYKYGESSEDNPNAPNGAGAPFVDPVPADMELTAEEDGPFRLVMPQKVEGPAPENLAYDSPAGTGDMNWNRSVKFVRAIEVHPLPPGVPAIDKDAAEALPDGEIVVYGNILNRKTFTVDQLKSIKQVTADYPWLKDDDTGVAQWTGIPVDYLLDTVIGLQDTATDVMFFASDGWGFKDTWTLDEIRDAYGAEDLKFLLGWNEDGVDLEPEPGDGPIRMIKPQFDPDDSNLGKWLKNTREVNVLPMGDDPGVDEGLVPTDRIIVCGAIDAGNVPNEWFFAEGCTGFGFETWISIANPNPWESHVLVDYYIEGEGPRQQELDVPARTRTTVNVASIIGEDKNVSTRVEGYHGDSIVAERAMYWSGRNAGHCASGVNSAAEQWYLAEGCTAGGFETWILLQNPGADDATVNLTYMTGEGERPGTPVVVPAQSRLTVNAAGDVPDTWDVSTMVESNKPVIAERAMYWNDRMGGHCETAVPSAADNWYLAEGATEGGFETWVLVQNPNDAAVTVDLTLMTDEGPVSPPALQDFPIAANSRHSFDLGDHVTDFDVSTQVTSQGGDVIAERAMYWNDRMGGHDAHGLEYAKFHAFMAEGCTAGGFQTWVLLQNPGPSDAMVYITYQTGEGAVERDPVALAAGSRVSLNVGLDVGETFDVSTIVNSSAPIVVERAVYWYDYVGGTCSTGYASW